MTEQCGVQVGVRIRPFNDRERNLNAQLCVEMTGMMTILKDMEGLDGGKNKEDKRFTFDASFWSHDGFDTRPDGYCEASPGRNYADQQDVFNRFGKVVLDNAWEGFHCCLFAYGQTGAGKSYSMVGYGRNRGIVPMACEEIFRRIDRNADASLKFEVLISMVEIYNEQVQDLLINPHQRPKKGLEIRESKQLGIYIDGVSRRAVANYKDIEAVVDEGTSNRTLGSTLMNATSSRAHTVLVIEFKQLSEAAGQTGCKVSLINLVDLAGSEKAGQTGASGDRLKEGCAINKSLSALGNVIEKLADKSTGKAKANVVIPYRDSKLTRLLQNALGGSSKTIMICAISPASSNYEETLSTLRYADRAKRIKNAAVVNENPADKLIRQLREENANLREMIGKGGASPGEDSSSQEDLMRKQAEIALLEGALHEMQKSFQDRLSEARDQAAQEAAAKQRERAVLSVPHIANLNEDQLLTNKLRFAFPEGRRTRIGRGGVETDAPEICLAGPGIQPDHATVENTGGKCFLSVPSAQTAEATVINGQSPGVGGTGVELKHGDRVAFGQCIFVFVDPKQGTADELLNSGQVSYAMARKELTDGGSQGREELEELKASRAKQEELERLVREAEERKAHAQAEADTRLKQREEEFRKSMEALEKQYAKERLAAEQQAMAATSEKAFVADQARNHQIELERLQREFEERQRRADDAAQKQIKELEAKAKKAAAEGEDHRQREINMRKLEEQLMIAMPLVKEANLISVELNRKHRFETKMQVSLGGVHARGSILVSAVVFHDRVRVYEWAIDTLENRVYLMRELLQRCEEEGSVEPAQNMNIEEDPFWDPVEPERQIGVAQVTLQGLLSQVDNQHDCKILSTETLAAVGVRSDKQQRSAHQVGTLRVEVWPCGNDGTPGVPDEEVVDDPSELLGTKMQILIHVPYGKGLPEELSTDIRVEFDFFIDEQPHQVPAIHGPTRDPVFNFKKFFVQDPVTSRFLEYCEKKTLLFRVYGRDAAAVRLKAQQALEEQEQAYRQPMQEAAEREAAEREAAERDAAEEAEAAEAAHASQAAAGMRAVEESPLPPSMPGSIPEFPVPTSPAPSAAQMRREVEEATAGTKEMPTAMEKKSRTCTLL